MSKALTDELIFCRELWVNPLARVELRRYATADGGERIEAWSIGTFGNYDYGHEYRYPTPEAVAEAVGEFLRFPVRLKDFNQAPPSREGRWVFHLERSEG